MTTEQPNPITGCNPPADSRCPLPPPQISKKPTIGIPVFRPEDVWNSMPVEETLAKKTPTSLQVLICRTETVHGIVNSLLQNVIHSLSRGEEFKYDLCVINAEAYLQMIGEIVLDMQIRVRKCREGWEKNENP